MRYSEEAYIHIQDARDKKVIARSAKNKVRGGGKYMRTPSDNLTKKEREAMNGEQKTYAMDRPTTYRELISWPQDIQKEYLQGLVDKYHAGCTTLGRMLGVSFSSMNVRMNALGIKGPGKSKRVDLVAWDEFLSRDHEVLEEPADPDPEPTTENSPEVKESPVCTPIPKPISKMEAYIRAQGGVPSIPLTPSVGTLCVHGKTTEVAAMLINMLNDGEYHFTITFSEKEPLDE